MSEKSPYTEEEIVTELNKRLEVLLGNRINSVETPDTIHSVVKSMIKDGYLGPAFYNDILVKVNLNKETGVVDITFVDRPRGDNVQTY